MTVCFPSRTYVGYSTVYQLGTSCGIETLRREGVLSSPPLLSNASKAGRSPEVDFESRDKYEYI